jgi:hypothetical protein
MALWMVSLFYAEQLILQNFSIVIELFARFGIEHGHLDPID